MELAAAQEELNTATAESQASLAARNAAQVRFGNTNTPSDHDYFCDRLRESYVPYCCVIC